MGFGLPARSPKIECSLTRGPFWAVDKICRSIKGPIIVSSPRQSSSLSSSSRSIPVNVIQIMIARQVMAIKRGGEERERERGREGGKDQKGGREREREKGDASIAIEVMEEEGPSYLLASPFPSHCAPRRCCDGVVDCENSSSHGHQGRRRGEREREEKIKQDWRGRERGREGAREVSNSSTATRDEEEEGSGHQLESPFPSHRAPSQHKPFIGGHQLELIGLSNNTHP